MITDTNLPHQLGQHFLIVLRHPIAFSSLDLVSSTWLSRLFSPLFPILSLMPISLLLVHSLKWCLKKRKMHQVWLSHLGDRVKKWALVITYFQGTENVNENFSSDQVLPCGVSNVKFYYVTALYSSDVPSHKIYHIWGYNQGKLLTQVCLVISVEHFEAGLLRGKFHFVYWFSNGFPRGWPPSHQDFCTIRCNFPFKNLARNIWIRRIWPWK